MNQRQIFLEPRVEQQFRSLAVEAGTGAHSVASEVIRLSQTLSQRAKRKYESPMLVSRPLIDKLVASAPGMSRSTACRAVIAAAALQYPETLAKLKLPAPVEELIPAALVRLSDSLAKMADGVYCEESDLYRKDLRFVVGQSVPCGAQDVDLFSSAPWSTVAKNLSVHNLQKYLVAGGSGVWFRIHTDPRHTEDFNEAGWSRCYQRIACLLEAYPTVRGMIGTSWFYDPQLIQISPRLAYLQEEPLKGGAFTLRNGPGEIHTERATLTSPSRRKLFEQGKYLPICWSVLWPRSELISWASRQAVLPH